MTWVGAAVPRTQDRRMLLGRGKFTGDLARTGTLHAAFVRSPFAAATLGPIDTSPALALPGVAAAFTAADLGDPGILAVLERPGFVPTPLPLLAVGQVRHVGEPVAVVLADDPYTAEDAIELIDVDWFPGPAVASLDASTAPGAAQVHHQAPGNCLVDLTMFDDEQLEGIFAAAPAVVTATMCSGRLAALPMEGRACLAEWDERDQQVVMHVSTQVPHQVRSAVAQAFGVAEQRVRVIAPDVGGGFGMKCVAGREEVAAGRDRDAVAPSGALGGGPAGEPDGVVPRPRAALPGARGVRPRTAGSWAWTPTSTAMWARTPRSRSPARSSR